MNVLNMIYDFYSNFFAFFNFLNFDSPLFRFIGFEFTTLGEAFTWIFTIGTTIVIFWFVISLFVWLTKLIKGSIYY